LTIIFAFPTERIAKDEESVMLCNVIERLCVFQLGLANLVNIF